MKKIVLKLSMLLAVAFTLVSCEKEELIKEENLPSIANTFLNDHFKEIRVVSVVKEKEGISGVEYNVVLENGIDITFDDKGQWKDVEARIDTNPLTTTSFILTPIVNYVGTEYPSAAINSIEKEKNGFDVELTNGIDLKFNAEGVFQRVD